MSFEIITPFRATVFGNKVNDEVIYHTLNYVYNIMLNNSEIFDESKINFKEFFSDLNDALENNNAQFHFSQEESEQELYNCLNSAQSFDELEFWYFDTDIGFEQMNEKIKNGAYLIKNA